MTDNSMGSDKAAESRRIFRPAARLTVCLRELNMSCQRLEVGSKGYFAIGTFSSFEDLHFTCDFIDGVFNSFGRNCIELQSISKTFVSD